MPRFTGGGGETYRSESGCRPRAGVGGGVESGGRGAGCGGAGGAGAARAAAGRVTPFGCLGLREGVMRPSAAILAVALASGCAAASNQSVAKPVAAQQQRACLPGENETSEQRARRFQALALARQINTLEYNVAMRNTKMLDRKSVV